MAILRYSNDAGEEDVVRVGGDRLEVVIGRKKECDLRTQNNTVSRMHAKVVFSNGRYLLQDLESANGTYYKRKRLKKAEVIPLDDGETIFCGNFPVEFKLDDQDRGSVQPEPQVVAPLSRRSPTGLAEAIQRVTPEPQPQVEESVPPRGTMGYGGAQATSALQPSLEPEGEEDEEIVCFSASAKPAPAPPPARKTADRQAEPTSDIVAFRQDKEVAARKILQEERVRQGREAELQNRLSQLEAELASRDDLIRKLHLQVEELGRCVKKYEEESSLDEDASLKVREMERVVAASQREVDALEEQLDAARQQVAEAEKRVADADSKRAVLSKDLQAARGERDQIKGRISELEGRVAEMEARPTSSPEDKAKLDTALAKAEEAGAAREALARENQEIEAELTQANNELSKVNTELGRVNAELGRASSEAARLKAEIDKAAADQGKADEELNAAKVEAAQASEALGRVAEERDAAIRERDAARQQVDSERSRLLGEMEGMRKQAAESNAQLAEAKTAGGKAEELANELKAATDELGELRVANRGYLKRIARLLEENERLRAGAGTAPAGADPAALEALKTENVALRADLDKVRGDLASARARADQFASRVGNLEAQLAAMPAAGGATAGSSEAIRGHIDSINELASGGRTSLEVISGLLPEIANLLPPGPEQQELVEQVRTNAAILAQTVRDIKTLVLQVRKVL